MSKHNSINCAQCGNATPTAEATPKFCSHCGSKFDSIAEGVGTPDSTKHQVPTKTIAAESDRLALDETHDSSFVIQPSKSAGKLQPGDNVGPFKLGCVLGSGGMGTVYEAHDTESDCPVALKILSRQVHATSEGVERFRRESQVAASINHPGSTFVYRSGQYGEQFFIAMELMNGGTLKDVVEEEGPLEVARAVDFIIEAIDGLAVAHQVGIVHRDFKPSNCFVDDNGRAKVGDFGLAKNFFGDVALTQTGTFVGTPQFAAPEQLRAGHVDARTDIYAVGGTLFYLLTGRAPFVGDAAQVISGIAAEQAPNIKSISEHVPEKLASLIAAMLEKDPARRPSSLEEIRVALLPFSSLGAVAPDNGQRMAAFFIDVFLFGFVGFGISMVVSPMAVVFDPDRVNQIMFITNFIALVGWFAIQEYVSGTTIGKWLFKMRITNEQNDSPGLWQAIVRPLLIPGTRSLLLTVSMIWISAPNSGAMNDQHLLTIGLAQLFSMLAWIPCLLLMLTARAANGYRGVHDLLTGTRVVRLSSSLDSNIPKDVAVTTPLTVDDADSISKKIEPFRTLGQFGSNANSSERILIGEDPELDRKVWIYESKDPAPPLSRATIRPTRQRIIASRKDDSCDPPLNYFIAECTEGMPLARYVESADPVPWTVFRPLLRELAAELDRSIDEDSLPTNFSEDNVWLDRSGRLKLVEISVENNSQTNKPAREVFTGIVRKLIENHPVPESIIELYEQWKVPDEISMDQIADTLDDMVDHPSSWTWIDRVGVICASLTVELSILFLLGQAWIWLCITQFSAGATAICGTFVLVALLVAFVTGFFFESPTFWFLGITARKRDKVQNASGFRLGMRCLVSWILPVLFVASLLGIMAASVNMPPGEFPTEVLVMSSVWMLVALVMLVVTLLNLAKPDRGIADLLCGTSLMRK